MITFRRLKRYSKDQTACQPGFLAADSFSPTPPTADTFYSKPETAFGAQGKYGWLTGSEIAKQVELGRIEIAPFDNTSVNPNSYNYHLHNVIKRLTNDLIDMKLPDHFEDMVIPEEGLILHPGQCYLGCTDEKFGSDHYASLITGRSSVGRKFITNHVTAGLIDQGFFGRITLEITVQRTTRVYPNIAFGQIFWFTSAGSAVLYAGKYHQQQQAVGSKAHLDFDDTSD